MQIPRLAPLARDDHVTREWTPSRQGVRALGLRPRGLTPGSPPSIVRGLLTNRNFLLLVMYFTLPAIASVASPATVSPTKRGFMRIDSDDEC